MLFGGKITIIDEIGKKAIDRSYAQMKAEFLKLSDHEPDGLCLALVHDLQDMDSRRQQSGIDPTVYGLHVCG